MGIIWRQYYNSVVNNTWIIAIWSNLVAIWPPSWICNSSDYLARFILVIFLVPWPQNMGLDTKFTTLRQIIIEIWPFWAIWLPSWRAFWPPSWVFSLPDYSEDLIRSCWISWPTKHWFSHQNYNFEVNIKRIITILSNLAAILAVILKLQIIWSSKKICFGHKGFFDPKNTGVYTKITTLR